MLQTWWLKATEIHSLTVLDGRSLKLGVCRAPLPPEAPGEPVCITSSSSDGSRHLLVYGVLTPIYLSPCSFLLCMFVSFLPSFIRTFVIEFRGYLGNPGSCYLKILNYTYKDPFLK